MTRKVLRELRAVALMGTLVLASGAAFAEDPIKLGVLEKYESALMGILLCAVGILIIVFET